MLAAVCRRIGHAPPQNGCFMPDRQDDLNPNSDLAPFADALKRLAPQPTQLSRDALLFAAGKAVASGPFRWAWPASSAMFAGLSFVLAAFLMSPDAPRTQYVDRVVYVEQPSAEPAPKTTSVEKPVEVVKSTSNPSGESSDTA